jgi:hypothetical protein
MASGTIFDNPWFTFERPAFERLAAQSDETLSALLIVAACIIVVIAMQKGHPIFKAVVLAYIVLP